MWGYLLAAMLMLTAAATEWRFGFAAERKPLEEVAPPLEIGRIRLKTGDGRPFMIVLLFATIGAWLASGFDGVSAIGGALIGMAAGVFLSWYLEAGSAPG
jgi:hypothetical protein